MSYLFLEEPLLEDEIARMMGRAVVDPLNPLSDEYIPKEPIEVKDQKTPGKRYDTPDIIPNILPEPIKSSRKDVVSAMKREDLRAKASDYFGINLSRSNEKNIIFESEEVQRYTLKQAKTVYDTLMGDAAYESQLLELLRKSPQKKIYMVSGFMTSKGGTWQRTGNKATKAAGEGKLPIADSTGTKTTDVELSVSQEKERKASGEEKLTEQTVIFAVKYHLIQYERSVEVSVRDRTIATTKRSKFRGPHRARIDQLALGDDDKDGLEIENGEETDDDNGDDEKQQQQTAEILRPKLADDTVSFHNLEEQYQVWCFDPEDNTEQSGI